MGKYIWKSFPGSLVVKNLPASAGDASSIPGSGRSPREGNGNRLQYSSLRNPMDRVALWVPSLGLPRVGKDLATKQQQSPNSSEDFILTFSSQRLLPSGSRTQRLAGSQGQN